LIQIKNPGAKLGTIESVGAAVETLFGQAQKPVIGFPRVRAPFMSHVSRKPRFGKIKLWHENATVDALA
jgi:hypothetical protein